MKLQCSSAVSASIRTKNWKIFFDILVYQIERRLCILKTIYGKVCIETSFIIIVNRGCIEHKPLDSLYHGMFLYCEVTLGIALKLDCKQICQICVRIVILYHYCTFIVHMTTQVHWLIAIQIFTRNLDLKSLYYLTRSTCFTHWISNKEIRIVTCQQYFTMIWTNESKAWMVKEIFRKIFESEWFDQVIRVVVVVLVFPDARWIVIRIRISSNNIDEVLHRMKLDIIKHKRIPNRLSVHSIIERFSVFLIDPYEFKTEVIRHCKDYVTIHYTLEILSFHILNHIFGLPRIMSEFKLRQYCHRILIV